MIRLEMKNYLKNFLIILMMHLAFLKKIGNGRTNLEKAKKRK